MPSNKIVNDLSRAQVPSVGFKDIFYFLMKKNLRKTTVDFRDFSILDALVYIMQRVLWDTSKMHYMFI